VTRAAFGFMQVRLFFATHILLTWAGVVKVLGAFGTPKLQNEPIAMA
jgi:hypothetical protein